MTLRTQIAKRALAGILAGNPSISAAGAARRAVEYADALLAELEKPK